MTRDEIVIKILKIFAHNFEIENPDLDENNLEYEEQYIYDYDIQVTNYNLFDQ